MTNVFGNEKQRGGGEKKKHNNKYGETNTPIH